MQLENFLRFLTFSRVVGEGCKLSGNGRVHGNVICWRYHIFSIRLTIYWSSCSKSYIFRAKCSWHLKLKTCVCYFLLNFYYSPHDSPKTMKNDFYSSKKLFLFSRYSNFCIFIFSSFFPVSHCFRGWFKKNFKVYDAMNCPN